MAFEWVGYEIINRAGRSLGWLGTAEYPQGVRSCSVEWTQYGQIHGSGSMTLDGSLDWPQLTIAPTRFVKEGSGPAVPHRRGLYLMSTGRRRVARRWEQDEEGVQHLVTEELTDVTLYGLEHLLSQVPVSDPIDWPAGTPYTEAMVEVLGMVGIHNPAVTHSPHVMPAPIHFSPGSDDDDKPTNLLSVHNKLAGFINYWSLRFDLTGRPTIAPYQPPRQRPVELRFAPDPAADWYRDGVGESLDSWDIPNMMVGVARREPIEGEDGEQIEQPPFVYTARNYDRGPFSYAGRGGRWIGPSGGPESVDAPDLTTLQDVMERRLATASNAARKWDVEALWQPFAGSEVAEVKHGDIDALATVVGWSEHVHDVAAPVALTLEEVL